MDQPGIPKSALDTPALLIDSEVMEANIATMARYFLDLAAKGLPVRLRPHTKTHKCPALARRQIEAGGTRGIACQKLGEAEVMAAAGITEDILIANQIVGAEKIARLVALRRRTNVMVCVDDERNLAELSEAAQAAGVRLGVLVELDVGMKRCGVPTVEEAVRLAQLADRLPGIVFEGLQGYEGHLVDIPDEAQRRRAVERDMAAMLEAKRQIEAVGLEVLHVDAGGTGTYHITSQIPGMTEIQAGSYIFHDGLYLKVIDHFRPALTLLTTVVSRPAVNRAILDIGLKSLGGDGLADTRVKDIEGACLIELSEEHGTLSVSGEAASLRVGDKIELIPGHGCTTINLHDQYFVLQDERLAEVLPIPGRGKFQ